MILVGIVAVLSFFLSAAAGTVVQSVTANRNPCALIDLTRPAQFVTYDGKADSKIRLRLRNNTTCAIVVQTDDTYPTEIKRLSNRGVRIEAVKEPRDGLKLPLHYLIQKRNKGEAPKHAFGWGDSVFTYEVPAGQSITFDVPASHLKKRYDLAVPFSYPWEGSNAVNTGIGGVVHLVYFLLEDLPATALAGPR